MSSAENYVSPSPMQPATPPPTPEPFPTEENPTQNTPPINPSPISDFQPPVAGNQPPPNIPATPFMPMPNAQATVAYGTVATVKVKKNFHAAPLYLVLSLLFSGIAVFNFLFITNISTYAIAAGSLFALVWWVQALLFHKKRNAVFIIASILAPLPPTFLVVYAMLFWGPTPLLGALATAAGIGMLIALVQFIVMLVRKKHRILPMGLLLCSALLGGMGYTLGLLDFPLAGLLWRCGILVFLLAGLKLIFCSARKTPPSRILKILIPTFLFIVSTGLLGMGGVIQLGAQDNLLQAQHLAAHEDYAKAEVTYHSLGTFRDAPEQAVFCKNMIVYIDAKQKMEAEDFTNALKIFISLGEFEDAESLAAECRKTLDYDAAIVHYEKKEYEQALKLFQSADDFKDSKKRVEECRQYVDYAGAKQLLAEKDMEGARRIFKRLGNFLDSKDLAEKCLTPFPKNGTVTRDPKFSKGAPFIRLKLGANELPTYLKVYTKDGTFAGSLFINGKGSVQIHLPAGTYRVRIAYGTEWYGEERMFGEEGVYYSYDSDFKLTSNNRRYSYYTLTYGGSDGSMSGRPISLEDF